MCHCEIIPKLLDKICTILELFPGRHENRLLLSLPAGLRQGLLWTICSGSFVSQLLEVIWSWCKAYVITITNAVCGAELFPSCGPHRHNDKASHHIQVLLRAIDQLLMKYFSEPQLKNHLFRIAARNDKGYGPATQVRWSSIQALP